MTAPQIEMLPLAALTPYAKNARTHSAEQLAQLVASIREFKFTNPILIDAQGGIIAGHGRVLAAQQVGLTEVPCLRLGHLTETQKRAYIITDNQTALTSAWDMDLLAQEIAALQVEDFDIDLLGFDADDLLKLFEKPNFEPGTVEEQGKLDQLAPQWMKCPHCGQEFNAREQG